MGSTSKSTDDDEDKTLLTPLRPYRRRFWILAIYSFLVWFQCMQWNLWGPLSESVAAAFTGWGSDTVAMMANWGPILYVLCLVPSVWLLQTKGLRTGILVTAFFVAVVTIMRILPFINDSDSFFKVMCHLAAILNGAVGPLVMTTPPFIASIWFPPRERTTATAIGQLFNQLGSAGSYLEPLIVRSPSEAGKADIRSDIKKLLYIYAGVGVCLFLAIFLYFPAKPPTPPSISSGKERINFRGSIQKLIKNLQFLLVFSSMVLSVSVPTTWLTMLNYSLKPLGIDQNEAMLIGFVAVVSSVVSGIAISRLTDLLYGHIRVTLLIMMVGDVALFYWFFLLTWGAIEAYKWQVYTSVIVGFSLNLSTIPLYTELGVESVYPCSELVVIGFLTFGTNSVAVLFLFIFLIPNLGYDWVTYMLLGTSSLSILPLLFVKEKYTRSKVDKGEILVENLEGVSL